MQLTLPVEPDGLEIPVLIGLDHFDSLALVNAQQPVPPPICCVAILDTGCNITCVCATVLRQLGIQPFNTSRTQTAVGSAPVRIFRVSLGIPLTRPNPTSFILDPQMIVMELAAPIPKIDVLIGRDILLNSKLFLDGPARQFTLEV